MTNFIEEQQREAHMAGLAKSKNAKDCGDLTVLPLGYVSGITKQTITNTLNHILESGLLEETDIDKYPKDDENETFDVWAFYKGHNNLARDIKEFISNMDTNSVDSIHLNKQAN